MNIAWYAIGRGPATLFLISPWSNLSAEWAIDALRMQYTAAAQVSTFIRLDPRGCGLSDRDPISCLAARQRCLDRLPR